MATVRILGIADEELNLGDVVTPVGKLAFTLVAGRTIENHSVRLRKGDANDLKQLVGLALVHAIKEQPVLVEFLIES